MRKLKIGYLGAGAWGYCLASLLASKGYEVVSWSIEEDLIDHLTKHNEHPKMKGFPPPPSLRFTTDIKEAIFGGGTPCKE